MNELEANIVAALGSDTKVTPSGYYNCYCKVCGDTKRKRGGFKFEEGKISYNCFRVECQPVSACAFEYSQGMSRKFKNVLKAFDVEIPVEYGLQKKSKTKTILNEVLYEPHTYKAMTLPEDFQLLEAGKHNIYLRYLRDRGIDPERELYIGYKNEWAYKIIFPFYYYGKLIGWQGLDIKSGKYLKSSGNSDMIFIPDGKMPKHPIVVEGVMDALSIPNAVAVLHGTITKKQMYIMRNAKPVLLPDRNAGKFLIIAKKYDIRISIPEWHYKDANEAVIKLGKLVPVKMIHDGIQSDITAAKVRYKMWCT